MGKVTTENRRRHVTTYRSKPGIRAAELAYGSTYGRERYATAKGRAYQLFKGARLRSKQRGFAFDLTLAFILERINLGVCPVLGLPFDLTKSGTHHNPLAPSIDRKDSSKGYTQDNVEVVSVWWNAAKGQWSEEFNKIALRRAVEYFNMRRFPWEL